MKKLGLDRVWWLVTPGNPLKDNKSLPSLDERIALAQALADHPRIDVTGFEAVIGTKYSCDTIAWLLNECPGVHFRLDHGRRQFEVFPPLEELARAFSRCCRSRSSIAAASA